MASASHNSYRRNCEKKQSIQAPFGIQIPSSLRDPIDTTFSCGQLESLANEDDARHVALKYLHDHERFANLWNSTKIHPNKRRLMRKVVQIQTINAVGNGYG